MAIAALEATQTAARLFSQTPASLSNKGAHVSSWKSLCTGCYTCVLGLPCDTDKDAGPQSQVLCSRRKIKAGQTLYREGDRFQFLYAVRSGTFKSSLTLADGREQVCDFHMAGELIGLDGVASGLHASNAVALEDTEVSSIAYSELTEMAQRDPEVQQVLNRLLSNEIVRKHTLMMMLGSMNAEERLATFLLNLSQRMQSKGYSAREFNLRMTRAEIGSHLGLTLETISRTLSSFQTQHLLEVDKRHIRITDGDGLRRTLSNFMH